MSKAEIRDRIEKFMDTDPGHYTTVKGTDIDAEFDRLTNSTWDED
jgi:hypothetical protein